MGIEIRTANTGCGSTFAGQPCLSCKSHAVELVIGGVIFKTDAPSFEAALRIVQTTTAALNIGSPGVPNYSSDVPGDTKPATPRTITRDRAKPTDVEAAPPACSECGWYLGHDLECSKGPFKFAKPSTWPPCVTCDGNERVQNMQGIERPCPKCCP